MKRIAMIGVALSVAGIAYPLFGQDIGEPGYVVGPNTFGPEARSVQPAYGTAGVTKLNLASMGLKPLGNGQWSSDVFGWSYRLAGSNNALCGNVHLPTGALLSGITTYTNDTATGDVAYSLYAFDMNTATTTEPFVFTTSGLPGVERIVHAIDPPIQIDNDDTAYALCVYHGVLGPTNLNAGATFSYKLQVSPPPGTATFNDVPTGHPQFQFIEALVAAGITAGCGAGNYCPDANLTRGQMAVFLAKALGLHFPN